MCLLVGVSEFCVFAIYNDHVAGFADWPLGHALRLYWCSIKSNIWNLYFLKHSSSHWEYGVRWGSGEQWKGNEVNNLFLGLSFNRITNDFPVANGRTIPRFFALAHTCATDSLAVSVFSRFLILLHVWAFLKLKECEVFKVIIYGCNYTPTVSLLGKWIKNGPGFNMAGMNKCTWRYFSQIFLWVLGVVLCSYSRLKWLCIL